ncbi:MAG: LuxR family transcriptional regulator, partial [Rhodospirillaceae bacterium]|nr:LuxR family transcriptional regulator [Rhodospirillaceae bacterium]
MKTVPLLLLLLNYPEDWVKYYFEKQFYNGTDFVVSLTPTLRKPYLWNKLQETVGLKSNQLMFLNESREAKLHNGLSIPIYGPAGEAYVVSYASSQPNPDIEAHLPTLRTLAYQFYSAFGDLAGLEDIVPSIKLTSRELECLTWAAEGKSAW